MTAALFFFLLLSIFKFNSVESQQRNSNITLGSSLTPSSNNSSAWLSRSGLYAFGFYPQTTGGGGGGGGGYSVGIIIVGISERTVVWTANRDDPIFPGNVTLILTNDGRLILQQRGGGQDINIATPSQPIASASMLDNGNFVLYGSDQSVLWQSFDSPRDTLLPGQRLSGNQLVSGTSLGGKFRLVMQNDGNLVQYPINTPNTFPYAYYSSSTAGAGNNVSLNLDNNGYLYLLNGTSFLLRNITSGGFPMIRTIYMMRLDVDGIFRVYSRSMDHGANWIVRWSSTNDTCEPKGVCGLNSFCTQLDAVATCRCLPGFDFIQTGNWSAGCSRNFSGAESCKNMDNSTALNYEIRTESNTVWEDNSYLVLDTITRESCTRACLDDCNCEVAFFGDRQCRMQRLPLRFGRRLLSDSNIALVKVVSSQITTGDLSDSDRRRRNEGPSDILIISITLVALAVLVLVISGIFVFHKKRIGAYKRISERGEVKLIEDVSLQAFTYSDLVQATNEFKEELGKGASGTVFKGILPYNEKTVAVKRLEKEFAAGEREFQTEMKVIGKTYHRNLVRLIGYCLDGLNRLLVFEYMSNGSLADILFKPENRPTWEERTKIARDIARGILYLHEECEIQIIHCDIKPQNILMDENRCAKISDFGLAKLLKQEQSNTYTGIRGTRGYVAPEWHRKQAITVKADVYSFGIVLLEIICCRRSVDWSLSEDEAVLEEWVYNCYEAGDVGILVKGEVVNKRSFERMVKIGIWCIQEEPSLRPSMKKVLLMLEGTVEIPVPPSPYSFLSSVS